MNVLSPEIQQAVIALARDVSLTNIRMVEFSARLLEQPPAGAAASLAVSTEVKTGEVPGGFVVEGSFALEAGTGPAEDSTKFLALKCRLGAVYQVPAQPLPPQEVLQAFASTNGMVHLWPYFRAYVQHTCAQLAITPLVLPPYRAVNPLTSPSTENGGGPERSR